MSNFFMWEISFNYCINIIYYYYSTVIVLYFDDLIISDASSRKHWRCGRHQRQRGRSRKYERAATSQRQNHRTSRNHPSKSCLLRRTFPSCPFLWFCGTWFCGCWQSKYKEHERKCLWKIRVFFFRLIRCTSLKDRPAIFFFNFKAPSMLQSQCSSVL